MFKVNNKNTRTFPAEQLHLLRSGVLIVILWTYLTPCSSVFIVNFEHVIASWDNYEYKLDSNLNPNKEISHGS